jgi:xylulokinase
MAVLIGLDVGTGGARALAVDADGGDLRAEAAAEYELLTPGPGCAEQRPGDWWEASREVLARVAREAGDEVAGLGLTGQMHGSVFLDEADEVIRPALLWNDQRTGRQCEEITERVGARELVARAGNPALTGFQAPKVLWLREHEPEHYARLRALLLPKDYIRLRLTGDKATDASDASGTLLLDVRERRWSEEILGALDLDPAWLPEVHEGTEATGTLRPEVAGELGLPRDLPVAAGGGDNAAAAVGVGVADAGRISLSIGTSGVVFGPTPGYETDPTGRVHAFCHALPGAFHLMAVTLSAGGSLAWWRRLVDAQASFDALVEEADGVAPGAEGLLFMPYLSGERTPHLDPHARGGFVGLSLRHGRAEMTRAVLEGVVFSLRDGLEIMRDLGVRDDDVRAVGGGSRSPVWRQVQADVLGRPIARTRVDEGPAYGAALLAGVACGAFGDAEEAMGLVRLLDEVTEPEPERARRYDELHAVYASLYASQREAMAPLAAAADGGDGVPSPPA